MVRARSKVGRLFSALFPNNFKKTELSKLVFQTNNQLSYSLTSYLFMEKSIQLQRRTIVRPFNENSHLQFIFLTNHSTALKFRHWSCWINDGKTKGRLEFHIALYSRKIIRQKESNGILLRKLFWPSVGKKLFYLSRNTFKNQV